MFEKIKIDRLFNLLFYLFLTTYTLLFCLISINRYWQYEVFYYDFGIFERAIYLMSQFKPPIIEHYVVEGKWSFADHFNPSLFLIALIYKLLPRQEFLLVIQVVFVSLSGLVVYKLAKEHTKNALFSFLVSFSYLFFIGVQNALITDFHAVVLANLFFALFVYFFIKKRFWLFLTSYILFLGFKENLFIIGASTLISLYLITKQWKEKLIALVFGSIAYGLTVIKIIIPKFSGGEFYYKPDLPNSPIQILTRFFSPEPKLKTLFVSFASFLFLPLINLAFYLPLIAELFIRFVPFNTQGRWGLAMHYNITTSIILAVSSVFAYPYIKKLLPQKRLQNLVLITLFGFSLLVNFKQRPPILLGLIPDFYKNTRNFAFLNKIVEKVNPACSVMTQNNILPHLNHNKKIFMLRENYAKYRPDIIILDLRKGQNPNNFWILNEQATREMASNLFSDKNYSAAYQTKEQFVFVRKGKEFCFERK